MTNRWISRAVIAWMCVACADGDTLNPSDGGTMDASADAGEPDAESTDMGSEPIDPVEWVSAGSVSVESWYPTRGGTTSASVVFYDVAPRLHVRTQAEDTCESFGPSDDPWAPDPRCANACDPAPGQPMSEYCGDDGECHPIARFVSAGGISVTLEDQRMELVFDPPPSCDNAGCYDLASAPLRALAADDLLEVRAAGDTFDGFEGSVIAPPTLTIVAPELVVFPRYTTVPNGSDLAIQWIPGDATDSLELVMTSLYGGLVRCRARDDGAFVIPWTHVSKIPTGTNEVELFIERRRSVTVETDTGTVRLSAASVESGTFLIEP